jgi:hypothetical protein
MALGAYRPLDDALRIAFTELIGLDHADGRCQQLDAYQLLSQVGKVHVTEDGRSQLRRSTPRSTRSTCRAKERHGNGNRIATEELGRSHTAIVSALCGNWRRKILFG